MLVGEIRKKLFRKNYFKLLLLGLVTPLLSGVTFGLSFEALDFSNTDNNGTYAVVDHTGSIIVMNMSCTTNQRNCNVVLSQGQNQGYYANSYVTNNRTQVIDFQHIDVVPGNVYMNQTNILYAAAVLFYSESSGGGSCDYSEYELIISTLSGSLATCQNSLSQCQASNCDTQLSQCIIDRDNLSSSVSTLSGSLASCNEDKTSLQNYNNSLSSQLNECLAGSGDNLTGESCFNYSMFWQDSDSNYSLPITNNLFLPNGYKGKYDEDNVLSIAKINSLEAAYQFSEEDKVTIIDILSIVMLFLLATGSLIGLIVFLKRLVINRK